MQEISTHTKSLYNDEGDYICKADIIKIWSHKETSLEETTKIHYRVLFFAFNSNVSINTLMDMLYDIFDSRCNCAGDCCGCWWGGINSIKYDGTHFIVETSYSRNF